MVVGTRSKTKGLVAELSHEEDDRETHQEDEKGGEEAWEEEVNNRNNQSWGVKIKKEIINDSLEKQGDGSNKKKERGTEGDPIKITDKESAEGLEKERGKNDWSIMSKSGPRDTPVVGSSPSSKRRLQGDKPSKRSKKYYKDIREYTKLLQTKSTEEAGQEKTLSKADHENDLQKSKTVQNNKTDDQNKDHNEGKNGHKISGSNDKQRSKQDEEKTSADTGDEKKNRTYTTIDMDWEDNHSEASERDDWEIQSWDTEKKSHTLNEKGKIVDQPEEGNNAGDSVGKMSYGKKHGSSREDDSSIESCTQDTMDVENEKTQNDITAHMVFKKKYPKKGYI